MSYAPVTDDTGVFTIVALRSSAITALSITPNNRSISSTVSWGWIVFPYWRARDDLLVCSDRDERFHLGRVLFGCHLNANLHVVRRICSHVIQTR